MRPDLSPRPGDLEPIERASRDELVDLQTRRLAATLRHAHSNIPHYRQAFAAAGVHPDDFRSLDDLRRFPFTTKADLRANYPYGMFAVSSGQIARIHASSGTTGKPTVVGYTRQDLDTWADVMARSIRAAGGRPGMRVHISYGYGLFTGGLGAHYGAERLGCAVIPMGGGQTERQVQLIQDFTPDLIMITPSYMLALLDAFRAAGHDPTQTTLKVGIFGAEPWTAAMRAEIERDFDVHALDIYGLSEVMGPGVACECVETKDGLHIWEDHFYPEIIDPGTGAVLPDGEAGELVFTSLTKQATPIIRYRTRDLTRLLPGTARSVRRMERITGRSDDMLIIRGVNLFPTQIEELVLADPDLSGHYQLELTRDGRLDHLHIRVEARPETYGLATPPPSPPPSRTASASPPPSRSLRPAPSSAASAKPAASSTAATSPDCPRTIKPFHQSFRPKTMPCDPPATPRPNLVCRRARTVLRRGKRLSAVEGAPRPIRATQRLSPKHEPPAPCTPARHPL